MSHFNFNTEDLGHFLSVCLKNISEAQPNPSPRSPFKDKALNDSYLSYLNSEWFYSVSDLKMAAGDAVIWGNLKLPARLKLEIKKRLPSELQSFPEDEPSVNSKSSAQSSQVDAPVTPGRRTRDNRDTASRKQQKDKDKVHEKEYEREYEREKEKDVTMGNSVPGRIKNFGALQYLCGRKAVPYIRTNEDSFI